MKTILILVTLLYVGLFTSGCGLISKKYTKSDSREYTFNSENKKKLRLENINGDITISRSSDSGSLKIKAYMEIKVRKKYLNTPFDEINIEIDTNTNEIIVKTDITNKGSDDFFNIGRSQKVDYNIYIPENLNLEIDNTNGDVFTGNISNNIEIHNVNGSADFKSFHGKLLCEITNGSVSGEIDSTRGINIDLVNGSITLKLSNYLNAYLKAETVNGRVTEENLELKDVIKDKKKLKAKIGYPDSESEINLETINGKIKLLGFKDI